MNDDDKKHDTGSNDEDFEELEDSLRDKGIDPVLEETGITPDSNNEDGDNQPHELNAAGDIKRHEEEEWES